MGVIRNTRRNTCPSEPGENQDEGQELLHQFDNLTLGTTNTDEEEGSDDVRTDSQNNNNNNGSSGTDDVDSIRLAERLMARENRRWIRKQEKRMSKSCVKPEATFRGIGCRGKSHRKVRRMENGNKLHQSLQLKFGFEFTLMEEEISIYDFAPNDHMSAFAILLMESEKMQAWESFVSQPEADQQRFLQSMYRRRNRNRR